MATETVQDRVEALFDESVEELTAPVEVPVEEPTEEPVEQPAEEVTEEISKRIGFTLNLFELRGDDIDQKEAGSPIWILPFWFRGDKGAEVRILVTEDSKDESIKADITQGLEEEVNRLGLGDRL